MPYTTIYANMTTYITDLTNDLYYAIDRSIPMKYRFNESISSISQVEHYLREHFRIYIKKGQLYFFAQCPDYKVRHRQEFLNSFGHHFNHLNIPYRLFHEISKELRDQGLEVSEVLRKQYRARLINRDHIYNVGHVIFESPKYLTLFKLKYSDSL